jgi:hypothetical protein
MERTIKKYLKHIFAKRRLLERHDFLKSENQRFEEILYMDDTPLDYSKWIEKKMIENNREIKRIEEKIMENHRKLILIAKRL